ncbi:M15 family metallopeptidase [Winogradskyella jejuensis]|uniref:D-alanyl-D-alanine carboxypeptidase n=1 Tax=Winogradskyella jejuensis TaxID=1089305 RepID=A0A1M5SBE6_9FLAO|nr:M15 family metallopeptidase [Winogradskyella jejuensis]SHH35781.1 D-alanyl-D-alanine carboxypeptidase [Winogradskyella jejuensis]
MKSIKFLIVLIILFNCKEKGEVASKVEVVIEDQIEVKVETEDEIMMDKDFLLGKFDYKTHPDFVKVDSKLSSKILFIQTETYDAYLKMHAKAKADGINLIIISGTRNFEEQKRIWNRKWEKYKELEPIERAKKIMEYSSMPSTSRHHWGTDLDLNNLTNSYYDSGEGKAIYDWLSTNANDFGFYQVYTNKAKGRTGYNLECWHWSYLPLASDYLTAYNKQITYKDISGFEGAEYAKDVKSISDYVNGISEKCKRFTTKK